ncbi:hypothetical protein CRI70_14915 [Streptomyces sp. Ru87]|nr:hypothetical protein CRI70_14915 [Streptomyces sp. Ru87]
MDEARDSFSGAATALEDWAEYMEGRQKVAVALEAEAAAVSQRLEKAYDKAGKLNEAKDDAKDTEKHKDKTQEANRAVNAQEIELEDIRRRARSVAKKYQEYGRGIASRLKSAMDIAPNEPGIWDKLGNAIEDLGDALADLPGKVADVLAEIGTWIKNHADWITVVASIVGVIAIFCPVLAPLAIGLSAVAFLAHASAYGLSGLFPPTGGNIGNWLTLGGDALGMVPGVGAVAQGVKAGVKAARTTQGVAAGTKVGIKTAGATAKGVMKQADPVAKIIDKPVMAAASRLGVSRGAALTATEGVQAAAMVAWTAPTAINAMGTSPGKYDAATWGTGTGNIVTGAGGGKVGGVVAIGSAIGLGMWELTD